jgi:hypothetical protein
MYSCIDSGCATMDGLMGDCHYVSESKTKQVYGQKPVALMGYMVKRLVTQEGQVVVDPFMGAGSTGVGAVNNRCSFIGCEVNAKTFFGAVMNVCRALVDEHGADWFLD